MENWRFFDGTITSGKGFIDWMYESILTQRAIGNISSFLFVYRFGFGKLVL
jgi:hypothetical protein